MSGITPTTIAQTGVQTSGAYGHDLACVADLDPSMVETDGIHCLTQAITRRFLCRRGHLIDDANYGLYLPDFLNADLTPADIALIQAAVNAECQKDERVYQATSTVAYLPGTGASGAGASLTVAINIVGAAGPFRLVLSVSQITVTVLQVTT